MNKRCKHIGKDGHRCGSYAFNLYKDDIDQGDLCDVHYWQAKAQRTWVGLTDEEVNDCLNGLPTQTIGVYARRIEAKLKEKNT